MQRFHTLALILLALTIQTTGAKANEIKFTTGIVALEEGHFVRALEALDIALAPDTTLKPDSEVRARIGRARALLNLAIIASNARKLSTRERGAQDNFALKLVDPVKRAAKDLIAARLLPPAKEKFLAGALAESSGQAAIMCVDVGEAELNQAIAAGTKAKAQPHIDEADVYAHHAISLDPKLFAGYALLAAMRTQRGDPDAAISAMNDAIKTYMANPPSEPTAGVVNITRVLAGELLKTHKGAEALDIVRRALELVAKDRARAPSADTPAAKAVRERVTASLDALELLEIEILSGMPDKREEAVAAGKRTLKRLPDSIELIVYVAGLQATAEPAYSVALYEHAIELAPKHATALFNLAVAYANQGALDKALPLFERTVDASADKTVKRTALEALVQVTEALKLTDKHAKYDKALKALK